MHRILRNRFISNLRKRRDTTDIDDVPAHTFATEAAHEDRLALKELGAAMTRLPADQREALVMVVVHGMSYEDLAEATGCAVGHGQEPGVPRPSPARGLADGRDQGAVHRAARSAACSCRA